jgi:hypothetical protein
MDTFSFLTRIEYDGRDGRQSVEVEVVTPHYRGAHAAAKVCAGFTGYVARVPHLPSVVELLDINASPIRHSPTLLFPAES